MLGSDWVVGNTYLIVLASLSISRTLAGRSGVRPGRDGVGDASAVARRRRKAERIVREGQRKECRCRLGCAGV